MFGVGVLVSVGGWVRGRTPPEIFTGCDTG